MVIKKLTLSLLLIAALLIVGSLLIRKEGISRIPKESNQNEQTTNEVTLPKGLVQPLDRAAERITKKRYGTKVSPTSSPVNPERFTGIHTGTDFEIFPDEENKDIPVYAICDGPVRYFQTARGYGGLLTQDCNIDGQAVLVAYGHIKLSSVTAKTGDKLTAGTQFALLGNGFSPETDKERKHLHLGIHKGTSNDTRGYVATTAELAEWLNWEEIIK